MREGRSSAQGQSGTAAPEGARQVPHDEKTFFESFYQASVQGKPTDRMTIGPISDPEARFHYNVLENSIIRALCHQSPPPRGATIEAWRMIQRRQKRRLLDVGSGTGHWVDFFREVFFVGEVVAVEISQQMVEHLSGKYAGDSDVTVLEADIASREFCADRIGGAVDWISAIGVMFHIVDDERWRLALANLAAVLKPGGLLLVGGDFGEQTRNVQFHRSDRFGSWKEFNSAEGTAGEVRVNKRVRSLTDWRDAASQSELRVVEVVRSDRDPAILTPENDLLVLQSTRS